MNHTRAGLAGLALLAATAVEAAPAVVGEPCQADLGPWEVTCDNTLDCTVVGGGAMLPSGAFLRIDRSGRAAARPVVTLGIDDAYGHDTRPLRIGLVIEAEGGRPIFSLTRTVPPERQTTSVLMRGLGPDFLSAVRRGERLSIVVGGQESFRREVNLKGGEAALRRMDERQRRVGTRTALVAVGPRPAAAMAPPPGLPVIRRGPRVTQTGLPKRPPPAVAKAYGDNSCYDDSAWAVYRLARGRLLWLTPCQNGVSYNRTILAVVTDEAGRALGLPSLPFPGEHGPVAPGGFPDTNLTYDPATRVLKTVTYCRSSGDCGGSLEWVWDGRRFRLWREMGSEHGVWGWPALYRARIR
ncbi:MAG: hypothetical protein JWP35_4579 [Caulobacter sp.]|nr:hypothetical protein [Caulobacter sp.]